MNDILKILALFKPSSLPSFWKLKEGVCDATTSCRKANKQITYGLIKRKGLLVSYDEFDFLHG